MCDMIKDLSLDNSGPQVDKVPKGGGVSFPEGTGCQFFPPRREVTPACNRKNFPAALVRFKTNVFHFIPV